MVNTNIVIKSDEQIFSYSTNQTEHEYLPR